MSVEADDARARLREKIEAVRTRFLARLGGRIEELRSLAERAAGGDAAEAAAARAALRRGLHNLAGAAPTLGLHAIGRKAAELEASVMAAPGGGLPPDQARDLTAALGRLADTEG